MGERDVRRGDVFLADLSGWGGPLLKRRPVLVVQNNAGNRFSTETIVAAIRDLHGGRLLPIFVSVSRGTGGLSKDSVIDTGHLHTVQKDALVQFIGRMPAAVMEKVDGTLRLSLGLSF